MRISSASSSVVHRPVKNSEAGIVRRPREERTSSWASSVRATAGYSAAGSAWAMEPPIVPRLRIWKCPMRGVARARSGAAAATSGLDPTAASVVPGPDPQRAVTSLDAPQFRYPPQVDQVFEHGQAQGQHGDQALASGQQLGVVSQLTQQLGRLGERCGAWYSNGAGFMDGPPCQWSISS